MRVAEGPLALSAGRMGEGYRPAAVLILYEVKETWQPRRLILHSVVRPGCTVGPAPYRLSTSISGGGRGVESLFDLAVEPERAARLGRIGALIAAVATIRAALITGKVS